MYNNESNGIPQPEHVQNINWGDLEKPKKESFFKKHGFVLGFLVGALCIILVCCTVVVVVNASGNLFVIGQNGISQVDNNELLDDETVEKLDEIYGYMNLYYYEDYSMEDIQRGLIDGLVAGVDDPYTVYYSPEEYEDMMVSTSGTYYGIGAGLTQDVTTMQVTVSKVYKGTPSEEAGMMNGDIIISANGIEATSVELSELVTHIRGEEGTTVTLELYRPSTEEYLTLDVERRYVELPSVEGEMLDGNIAYVTITEFQAQTDEQFIEIVEGLVDQGAEGFIIDVRGNPGGYLSSVVNLLDYVLPEGLTVYCEDKYGNRDEYASDASCLDIPMVVLVDGSSASASEIFAGALKDYEYATLVGTTTYGKGIVQSIIELSDGDALKITTAKYFTPDGNYIHGVGIEPDVVIEYEYTGPEDQVYDKQYDNQFLKAVEEMNKLLEK